MMELVEYLAAKLASKAQDYVVIMERDRSLMLKLANGEPTVVQSWDEYTVTVYAAKDQRINISSFRTRDPATAVDKVLRSLDKLEPSPLYAPLPEPTGRDYKLVDPVIAEAAATGDISRIIEDLELDQAGDAAGMIQLSHKEKALAASTGARLQGAKTSFNGYIRVFQGEDASGQWSWTTTRYDPVTAKKAIAVAQRLAEECKSLPMERLEPGEYRVLLSPMVAGNLLETLVQAATGGAIAFGMSFLTRDSLGKQVASEKLTIQDAPEKQELPGYRLFDDEAVAARDKYVIRQGSLETILNNSKTAKLLGLETTGNAGLLMPRAFNIIVEPGDLDDNDMLEALGTGLYATNNWYTRFQNYVEGTFSTVTRDALFIVRNGKPVACAKRARITGSIPGLVQNVEALGRTLWPIQWWEVSIPSLLPNVLVSRIGITSD